VIFVWTFCVMGLATLLLVYILARRDARTITTITVASSLHLPKGTKIEIEGERFKILNVSVDGTTLRVRRLRARSASLTREGNNEV
jgi:hypothetical protein